jgi:hypothetical protein
MGGFPACHVWWHRRVSKRLVQVPFWAWGSSHSDRVSRFSTTSRKCFLLSYLSELVMSESQMFHVPFLEHKIIVMVPNDPNDLQVAHDTHHPQERSSCPSLCSSQCFTPPEIRLGVGCGEVVIRVGCEKLWKTWKLYCNFFWVNCKDPSDLTRDDAFGWEVVEKVGEKRLVSDFRRNCVLFILKFTWMG